MTQDRDGGREWRPYEIAMPVARDGAGASEPPGAERSPYAAPHAAMYAATGRLPPAREQDATSAIASLGKRLAAASIDIGLWFVPALLVIKTALHVYRMQTLGLTPSLGSAGSTLVVAGAMWLGLAVWNLVWLALHAQSVGKRFMRIRIVRSDGSPAGFWRLLLLRGGVMSVLGNVAARVLPPAASVLWLVDVLFVFSENHRTLHDRIADTIVVDA